MGASGPGHVCLAAGLSVMIGACGLRPDPDPTGSDLDPIGAQEAKGPPTNHRKSQSRETLAAYLDPQRDEWNRPSEVIQAMEIQPGDTVCDLGAGSGYFTFRLAEAVGPTGSVLAHDIDPQAIEVRHEQIAANWSSETMAPITVTQNEIDDPMLPYQGIDHLLMVDVHFVSEDVPRPRDAVTLSKLFDGIKPGGTVSVIEQVDDPQQPREEGQKRAATAKNLEAQGFLYLAEYEFVRNHFFLRFERPLH